MAMTRAGVAADEIMIGCTADELGAEAGSGRMCGGAQQGAKVDLTCCICVSEVRVWGS